MGDRLPVGKLPAERLAGILARAPVDDPRVVLGPGIGLDCAVVEAGGTLLVYKSDPITFATDAIGHYLVQINANDVATTGAEPRWLLVTLLLPERSATGELAERIMDQVYDAARAIGVSVIGGHTEITPGLDRPIAVGALVGEVARDALITPRGARPGDRLLLTKGVPIETTAILAREFPERLAGVLDAADLERARAFLYDPGIGVLGDARAATGAGRVTAMHDPTEGGIATALWELAEASGCALRVDPAAIPVPALARRVCEVFRLDPLECMASGALLLAADPADAEALVARVRDAGIDCADIGEVAAGPAAVERVRDGVPEPWSRPARDALARVYERE